MNNAKATALRFENFALDLARELSDSTEAINKDGLHIIDRLEITLQEVKAMAASLRINGVLDKELLDYDYQVVTVLKDACC